MIRVKIRWVGERFIFLCFHRVLSSDWKSKVNFVRWGEGQNCFVENLERTLCAASTPPQRRGHTRDLNVKGVSRPRTGFGGCREKGGPAVEFRSGSLASPGRSFQVH